MRPAAVFITKRNPIHATAAKPGFVQDSTVRSGFCHKLRRYGLWDDPVGSAAIEWASTLTMVPILFHRADKGCMYTCITCDWPSMKRNQPGNCRIFLSITRGMRQFWPCASRLGERASMKLYQPSVCSFSNAPVCWTVAGLAQWIKAEQGGCQVTSIDFWSAHFATRTTQD